MSLLSININKLNDKKKHSLRYYVCPKNMNEAYHTCPFKGINAQMIETEVLNTCKAYCDNPSFHDKLNKTILKALKHQQMKHRQSHLTQEQLIENWHKIKLISKRLNVYLLALKEKNVTLIIHINKLPKQSVI